MRSNTLSPLDVTHTFLEKGHERMSPASEAKKKPLTDYANITASFQGYMRLESQKFGHKV